MSGIGWIDFSSEDRARVQEVLNRLKEPGTLDELGIGQVRDAFSDLLFPGFSTIQTRARYFLEIPKIMLDWSAKSTAYRRKHPLPVYLRDAENDLARTLKANYEALNLSPENVIGHTVVERGGVARRPSSTYWNGLRVFQIVDTSKSLAEFCREWRQGYETVKAVDSDEGSDDSDQHFEREVRRPPNSTGPWRAGLTLDLDKQEAEFLATRFKSAKEIEHSVAAQLLSTKLVEAGIGANHETFAAFSLWANRQTSLSLQMRVRVKTAQRFSAGIEGAHIIFNRLLAERLDDEDLRSYCIDEYKGWKSRVAHANIFHATAAKEWLDVSMASRTVKKRTVNFLHDWTKAVCENASQRKLDELVRTQALANKPGRSLLERMPRAKAAWYGMKALEYRWPTARRMLRDLLEGQKCSA